MSGDSTDGRRSGRSERDSLSRILGALADPTRRAMLEHLRLGPASVSELAAPMPMSLAAVSKHLGVLEDAGLVTRGRAAQYRPARLELEPLAEIVIWMEQMVEVDPSADAGPTGDSILTVTRVLLHPPEAVWTAWTDPAQFARWFGTEAVTVPVESVVLETFAGGALRARMLLPDGSIKDWEGVFVEAIEPTALVFTLTDEPGSDPGEPIAVQLRQHDHASTLLTLRQSTDGFDAEGIAALHAGYSAFFEAMEQVINDQHD